MSGTEAHVSQLTDRHHQIDEQIAEESRRPNPDQSILSSLKRQKLRLKEEITSFQT